VDSTTLNRSYAATGYYLPNRDRPNLTVGLEMRGSTSHADTLYHQVLTEATVAKVLFADVRSPDDTLTATGVEFRLGSDAYVVHAQKEVIISAGTIKSPQLLELSGIGRKDVLDRLGVDVKIDLPGVGENVQEHVKFGTPRLCLVFQYGTVDPLRYQL
jgi:choline dehydrogenase-like flavoprotein